MELQAIGAVAITAGLHFEMLACRQKVCTKRQIEALAMPVIDVPRKRRLAQAPAHVCRINGMIADFNATLRMPVDARAKVPGQHLRAKAQAQKGLVLGQRHANPVDLAAQVVVAVIGAHRAAEDDRASMIAQRRGQRVAKARAANVEIVSRLTQQSADPAGRRQFLMKDHQDASG